MRTIATPTQMKLITIPMSHYCEKARWGLERLGIRYHEERHLQGFHYLRTYSVSKGPIVPVLIDGGRVIVDSTAILKHLDQYASESTRLYSDDPAERARIEELEDLFDDVLGVESRRWVYYHMQRQPIKAIRIARQGTPVIQTILMPLIYPALLMFINKRLKPTEDRVNKGMRKIRQIIRQTDKMLAGGHRYLLGARFTAADLSLACMLAPLVAPRNYGIRLPRPEEMPRSAQPDLNEFISTDSGRYVLSLFENERIS